MFDNIFLHGNFEEEEIRVLNRIDAKFKDRFSLTITVQVLDNKLDYPKSLSMRIRNHFNFDDSE